MMSPVMAPLHCFSHFQKIYLCIITLLIVIYNVSFTALVTLGTMVCSQKSQCVELVCYKNNLLYVFFTENQIIYILSSIYFIVTETGL